VDFRRVLGSDPQPVGVQSIMTESFIRQHANAVLQICSFYLGKGSVAEQAFTSVFCRIDEDWERAEIYRAARRVCREKRPLTAMADSEAEEWFYLEFLGLSIDEAEYICSDFYLGQEPAEMSDVSKLSFFRECVK